MVAKTKTKTTLATTLEHVRDSAPKDADAPAAPKLPKIGPTDFPNVVGDTKGSKHTLYGPNNVSVAFVEITPTFAAELLAIRNVKNRKFIKTNHEAIALAIQEGRFVFKGDTLVFGTNGALLDGQNRLQGIVDGGKTVYMLAIFGINPDFQAIMDKGRPRTHAQSLDLVGHDDTRQLSSALGTLARIIMGTYAYNSPTDERLVLLEDHPKLTEWLKKCDGVPGKLGEGRVAAVAYSMDKIGKGKEANRMLDIMREGATSIAPIAISKDDPALRVSQWASKTMGRIPEARVHNTLVHAANLIMEGKTLGAINDIKSTPQLNGADVLN